MCCKGNERNFAHPGDKSSRKGKTLVHYAKFQDQKGKSTLLIISGSILQEQTVFAGKCVTIFFFFVDPKPNHEIYELFSKYHS